LILLEWEAEVEFFGFKFVLYCNFFLLKMPIVTFLFGYSCESVVHVYSYSFGFAASQL